MVKPPKTVRKHALKEKSGVIEAIALLFKVTERCLSEKRTRKSYNIGFKERLTGK